MNDKKKYDSGTLSQQKKAREEFLKLKKSNTENNNLQKISDSDVLLPKTFGEKFKNFWFYYRWAVLGTILTIVAISLFIAQCVSKTDYDLEVTLYTADFISDSDADIIQQYMEKYCEDINDDGEINVLINNCSYSTGGNTQAELIANTKIHTIIAAEYKAVLFITDDTTRNYLNTVAGNNGFFENESFLLNDKFYEFCKNKDSSPLPNGLTISCRIINNTVMQKNKTAITCHESAQRLIKKLNSENTP